MCPSRRNYCSLQLFFYFISATGNSLWEAVLWRETCGSRIRDPYAWWQGIRRKDESYISGIHESTGRSVSVGQHQQYFHCNWISNSVTWKLQWTNLVPVYFICSPGIGVYIYAWIKYANIHSERTNFSHPYLPHNNTEWQLSVFTHRLCCCLVGSPTRSLGLKAISICWKKERIGTGQTGVAMMTSCSHYDRSLA